MMKSDSFCTFSKLHCTINYGLCNLRRQNISVVLDNWSQNSIVHTCSLCGLLNVLVFDDRILQNSWSTYGHVKEVIKIILQIIKNSLKCIDFLLSKSRFTCSIKVGVTPCNVIYLTTEIFNLITDVINIFHTLIDCQMLPNVGTEL